MFGYLPALAGKRSSVAAGASSSLAIANSHTGGAPHDKADVRSSFFIFDYGSFIYPFIHHDCRRREQPKKNDSKKVKDCGVKISRSGRSTSLGQQRQQQNNVKMAGNLPQMNREIFKWKSKTKKKKTGDKEEEKGCACGEAKMAHAKSHCRAHSPVRLHHFALFKLNAFLQFHAK